MREPELSSDFLYSQYITEGKNRYQISSETGVDPVRIGTLLQKYGIKRRSIDKHGLSMHPLNVMWQGMKERCQNPNASNYQWYGERGITVCAEWQEFINFFEWAIQHGWEEGLTIDRIDVNGAYEPRNCRFVPLRRQFRNRRTNCHITIDGETHLQCEWEELLGLRKKIIAKWKYEYGIDAAIAKIREAKDFANKRNN